MRTYAKFFLPSPVLIALTGGVLFVGGCLSIPRDYSSPSTSIRIIDQSGAPMSGIEVGRRWYDSDCATEGSETTRTGMDGTAQFPRIPAKVGVFTGAWRKTYTSLGSCSSGSGTWTTIYVRFAGQCDVMPKERPSHDDVSFYTSIDSQSNTMANISFLKARTTIDYVLSAKPHGQ